MDSQIAIHEQVIEPARSSWVREREKERVGEGERERKCAWGERMRERREEVSVRRGRY